MEVGTIMDFMASMKAEMQRKRKGIEDFEVTSGSSKYVKRGDILAKQEKEYLEKQKKKYGEQVAETSASSSPASQRDGDAPAENSLRTVHTDKLPHTEVIVRLRQRGQPTRLFGENDEQVRARLIKLEVDQPDLNEGWSNDFESARRAVDNDIVKEVLEGTSTDEKKHDVQLPASFQLDWDKIVEEARGIGEGEDDPHRDCYVISSFFKYILARWGRQLNERDDDVKKSNTGKHEAAFLKQTVDYLNPLMKSLDSRNCNNDIRHHLAKICRLQIIDRNYLLANNAYMEMAIGNAPWPVGVTRSGIHQRPGSAKSYVSNVAHVLNDETQRKYIQSVKRLITKCQDYFPTDPSKCVEFVRKD